MALQTRVDGPADGPVLVLVPSLGTDATMFDAQVAAFADRFRIVRVDLPGPGAHLINVEADAVNRALDAHFRRVRA
jgi:pimeloyl-ACP methyl ester carboxylesterase